MITSYTHKKRIFCFSDVVKQSEGCSVPKSVILHNTETCNLRCSFCWNARHSSSKEQSDVETFNSLIKDLGSQGGLSLTISGGGEPTTSEDFPKLVRTANELGLKVGVITNGNYSKEKCEDVLLCCDWVRFSIHSFNPDNYKKITGGNSQTLTKVLSNIHSLIRLRQQTPKVSVSTVINEYNCSDDQILSFAKFATEELGVDYCFFRGEFNTTMATQLPRSHKELSQLVGKLSDLSQKSGMFINYSSFVNNSIRERISEQGGCVAVNKGLIAIIDPAGEVFPCFPLYYRALASGNARQLSFGNINQCSIADIWKGKRRQSFIKKLSEIDCPVCKYEKMDLFESEIVNSNKDLTFSEALKSEIPHWQFL